MSNGAQPEAGLPRAGMRLLWIYCGLLALLLVPLFVINLYNHPTADDFWYSGRVAQFGFWGAQRQLYTDTSARLLSNFLMCLWPLDKGVTGWSRLDFFWLFPMFWLSLYALGRSLQKTVAIQRPLLCSFVAAGVYFLSIPGIYEGVYWTSAVVVYQLSLVLLLWWVKCYLEHRLRPDARYLLLTALLSVSMLLLNERVLMYLGGAVFLLYVYQWRTQSARRLLVLNALVIIATLAFIFLSKCNWDKSERLARASSFSIPFTLLHAFRGVGWTVLRALANPVLLLGLLLLCQLRLIPVIHRPGRLAFVTVVFLAAFFASTLPVIYVYGRPCPLRILNMGTLFLYPLAGAWVSYGYEAYLRRRFPLLMWAMALCAVAYFAATGTNTVQACKGLADGTIPRFDRQMQERFRCLNDPGREECVFEPIKQPPSQLFWNDWDIAGFVLVDVEHTFHKRIRIIR